MSRSLFVGMLFLAVSAVADPPGYVQILAPFDTVTLGDHAARWSAELRVRNSSDEPINLFPETCSWIGREEPCTWRIDVPPQTVMILDVVPNLGRAAPGILLYVPTDRVDDVQFDLRVRALANSIDPVGTPVPVVRSSNYHVGRTTFINVPVGPGLRGSLRVFGPDHAAENFRVRVLSEPDGELLFDRHYFRPAPTDPVFPARGPMTFDYSEALAAAASDAGGMKTVTVVIERGFGSARPYWPMISVVDAANRVTILTVQ